MKFIILIIALAIMSYGGELPETATKPLKGITDMLLGLTFPIMIIGTVISGIIYSLGNKALGKETFMAVLFGGFIANVGPDIVNVFR